MFAPRQNRRNSAPGDTGLARDVSNGGQRSSPNRRVPTDGPDVAGPGERTGSLTRRRARLLAATSLRPQPTITRGWPRNSFSGAGPSGYQPRSPRMKRSGRTTPHQTPSARLTREGRPRRSSNHRARRSGIVNPGHWCHDRIHLPRVRLPHLSEMPRSVASGGSYEICWSCGFEFGVTDDDLGFSYGDWRRQWVDQGMPWSSASIRLPPDGWDPVAQLRSIGAIE